MKVLGITGTSGSGKTALSEILKLRDNVIIIDADKVVKEISVPGTEYFSSIKESFGNDVILENGNLNRKVLAEKIYSNKEDCEKLNKLTFKYVVKEIVERIKKIKEEQLENNNYEKKRIDFLVIDAPLLFESGLNEYCDYIISLIAEKELKIERICARDNIDRKTAEGRLSIQQSDEYYIEKSDFIINNNRECDLKKEIEKLSIWGR